jgi:hypothetical protein
MAQRKETQEKEEIMEKTREEIISIMTNAIAWELEREDQPEDGELMTTQANIERYKKAAERAYRQGIEGKD